MSENDPEFEEFLKRRRPLFRGDVEDDLAPPAELDRVVLRQAREAIREDEPLPLYRGPRWAAPLAVAATVLLALGVVFIFGQDGGHGMPEVSVENAAQRVELPPPPPAPPPAPDSSPAGTAPEWRKDPQAWLAEISRLRSAGETERADAELAEYNRQRAFAASPDR